MRRIGFMPSTTAEAPVYSPKKNRLGRPIFCRLRAAQEGQFAGGSIQGPLTLAVLNIHTFSKGMIYF
jgi:hypothetical protein